RDGMPSLDQVVLHREYAPDGGAHAQHRKVVSGDELGSHQLGAAVEAQAGGGAVTAEHVAENFVVVADVLIHRVGDGIAAGIAAVMRAAAGQQYQFFGVLYRQQLQNDLVDQGKDGGVGADPERQRKNGYAREDRRLEKRSKGIAKILDGSGHHSLYFRRVKKLPTECGEPDAIWRRFRLPPMLASGQWLSSISPSSWRRKRSFRPRKNRPLRRRRP